MIKIVEDHDAAARKEGMTHKVCFRNTNGDNLVAYVKGPLKKDEWEELARLMEESQPALGRDKILPQKL